MEMFAKLIRKGDTVFDIGAHIGYVGNYLAWLTGPTGQVFCFEPSPVNLPYLRVNAARCSFRNITVIAAAAGDHVGEVPFFVENVSGQNSSLVPEFKMLEINSRFNGIHSEYEECTVQMSTADSVGPMPNFVKIDAEGSELMVLSGMSEILCKGRPRIMIESDDGSPAVHVLEEAGYILSSRINANLFAVHRDDTEAVRIIASPH